MHSILLKTLIGAVLIGALLAIGQIWFLFMSWETFAKAIVTIGIVVVIAAFLMVVGADFGSQKNLKDENYLD